ncbi:MAG: phosphoadenosine phosphosulfate reductase family protein [Actinobacteria bacterium]|nr:phosphoadenosine phosphosulfate reductase family protein [Actinomycetota bacterium]
MKCKVCRGHAVVDIRRHNAAFCTDHFTEHIHNQVAKAIKEFHMFGPDARLLIAVSGGKDSLALWDILLQLGYDVTGFYLDLGIGSYSTRSKEATIAFAEERDAKLIVRSLAEEHGFTVPELASLTNRVPCSGCGLNKRYEFNRAALEEGFDILVTGHNLDDEVATLFGNVLHWNTDMLARQGPVLEERVLGEGDRRRMALVRKVKPLVRVAERETAAYAVVRGIDYIVEECPMVEGNVQHKYKEAIAMLEESSPGTKHQMYFGFLKKAASRFADETDAANLVGCANCGSPTIAPEAGSDRVCSFCRMQSLAQRRRDDGYRARPVRVRKRR